MEARNTLYLAGAVVAGLVLGGCGSATTSEVASTASTVSGAVSSDVPVASVSLRDASAPVLERTVAPDAEGNFSLDVTGLTPPYILGAGSGASALYAIALHGGNADVNGLTSVAVAGALRSEDDASSGDHWEQEDHHEAAQRMSDVIRALRVVLKPLFDLYGVTRIGGDDDGDVAGMRALLRDVSFTLSKGVVTVTNRATGGVIFTGPLADLSSGVFHPESMPAGPGGGTTACAYTYSDWGACANGTQTRTVIASNPAGCTGTPVLSQACSVTPPPPTTCTSFTYSALSPAVCPASGQQTRTVVSSAPAGCTGGNPVLTVACAYVPPPPNTCTSFTYSALSPAVCPASGQQTRTVVSSAPAGCTGGNPVLTVACAYVPPPPNTCASFTYNAWTPATCPASGQQSRTVATSSPAGCTGGSPVLTQSCAYVPPPPATCTSFTYSAWGTCSAQGQQTRTVVSSAPAGCTGGSPVLTQACTPPVTNPVTKANIVSSCTVCHGLTSNTTVYKSGGYSKSGASSATWLNTVNNMVGLGASLAPGTTAQNYADALSAAP